MLDLPDPQQPEWQLIAASAALNATGGRHRARHRLKRRRNRSVPPGLWFLVAAAVVVVTGVVSIAWAVTGLHPGGTSQTAAQATELARQNPATAERARSYLDNLDEEGIHVEPRRAVFYGEAVCAHRHEYNSSLVGLTEQVWELTRDSDPGLTRFQVHRLVDNADSHLCQEDR